jgi:tetratricopeptide (TPR) repeat protein
MKAKRALLSAAVASLVLAIGCGQALYSNEKRDEARQRWANSRAEMATRLAEGCYQRGEFDRARDHIGELIRTGAPYAPMYVVAARLSSEKGDLDTARAMARNALAIDPDLADAHYVLGSLEQMLGHPDEALAQYADAARLEPDQAKYILAETDLLIGQGRAEEAAASLAAAAERMPGRADIHVARGDALDVLGQPAEAVASYRAALRLTPQRTDLKERLAVALFSSGAYAEAQSVLADLDAAGPDAAAAWANLMRADSLLALGRSAEARVVYSNEVAAHPDSAVPLIGVAKCDILANRLPAARKSLEQALAISPHHAEANALMGFVLVADGRPAEAVGHLSLALGDPTLADRAVVEQVMARAKSDMARRSSATPPVAPASGREDVPGSSNRPSAS